MATAQITPLEVFKSTPQNNCGECGLAGCMAFSLQVVQGLKEAADCPYLEGALAASLGEARPAPVENPNRRESLLEELMREMPRVDFASAAARLGGESSGERLAIRCLGKIFEVDGEGGLHSECHIHSWVHLPVLQYVVHGDGKDPAGTWVLFREVEGFREWERFFSHRCEKTLQEMADADPELFFDVLELFGRAFQLPDSTAERAVLLHPLPKVPIAVLYWPEEDGFESKLSLLFDRCAEINLGAEGTYLLVQGIVEMLRKIISNHAR